MKSLCHNQFHFLTHRLEPRLVYPLGRALRGFHESGNICQHLLSFHPQRGGLSFPLQPAPESILLFPEELEEETQPTEYVQRLVLKYLWKQCYPRGIYLDLFKLLLKRSLWGINQMCFPPTTILSLPFCMTFGKVHQEGFQSMQNKDTYDCLKGGWKQ